MVFDRGYVDYAWLNDLNPNGVWFVTRAKTNMIFKIVESQPTDRTRGHICDLYKSRWKVELFFKTLKQHLRIKKFLGTSANAVKAQILITLIAYLLVQILRFKVKTSISIVDAMAVIETLLLLKQPLSILLGDLPNVNRHPMRFQMSFDL